MKAPEPEPPDTVRRKAAAKLRQAITMIGLAAGGELRDIASDEYFALNRIWHSASQLAEQLETPRRRPPQQIGARRK